MIPTSLGALAALRVPMTGASGGGLAYCSAPASPAGRDVTLTLRSPMGSDPGSGDERGDLSNLHSRLLKSFEVGGSESELGRERVVLRPFALMIGTEDASIPARPCVVPFYEQALRTG